ncbi:unnamed protein product [Caenorhabditis auriculariae]|uniref:Metalloendopeptidase n=1 Tax=Caenorhabditis auriculariae TaxID=2777116 RepID=A0A8S1GPG0_9PELO|nr:unnamed protein product [Caenorhabditis auriculariae]
MMPPTKLLLIFFVFLVANVKAQDFMSFLSPFLGGGGGGGGGGNPLGAAGGLFQQFAPSGGGNGGGFGDLFKLGSSFLNRMPPPGQPAPAAGPRPAPAPVPTDADYATDLESVNAAPARTHAVRTNPHPRPSQGDYDDNIDMSLTRIGHNGQQASPSIFKFMDDVFLTTAAPKTTPFTFAPFTFPTVGSTTPFTFPTIATPPVTLKPVIPTTASPKLFAHNAARMIREIATFSDTHGGQNQDYGAVQSLMEAFFEAVATNKPTPADVPIKAWTDGTELGPNRVLTNKLFESDMVLTVITGAVYRWPTGPIPYRFKGGDEEWKGLIKKGLNLWERETCVRWQENGPGKDYVIFFRGSGCYSSVGRTGGSQMISIGYGCEDTGIISHEVGHSLGFWHEQSRPDRDQYIDLRKEWIIKGTDGNFERRSWEEIEDMGLPYDLGSVMHYGGLAFTKDWDQVTMATRDKKFQRTIGQRAKPSFIDVKQVNRLYCNNVCPQMACEHGGYADPNDCSKCKCPDGLAGRTCELVAPGTDAGCGGELIATGEWQVLNYRGKRNCNWRIKAPNSRIRFILNEIRYRCEQTCKAFIEIKSNSDFQQTGFRTCCFEEHVDSKSDQSEMLVMSNAKAIDYEVSFVLKYIADNGQPLPTPPPSTWVPGKENRPFRGDTGGPIEKFILNAIPKIRDPNRPLESVVSIVTQYGLATLFGVSQQ